MDRNEDHTQVFYFSGFRSS